MSDLSAHHDVFQAVADPTRREIIRLLAEDELPIAAIVRHFPITRTAVNKHLEILTDAGLLNCRRTGRETRFKLRPDPLRQLQRWVSFYERYWDEHLDALRKYVEPDQES
jgi:DNA-binding transcriptional ArsR family regulator